MSDVPEIFPRCNALVHHGERSRTCEAIATRRLPPECTRYGTDGLCEAHWKEQLWAAQRRAAEENRLVAHLKAATRTFRNVATKDAEDD